MVGVLSKIIGTFLTYGFLTSIVSIFAIVLVGIFSLEKRHIVIDFVHFVDSRDRSVCSDNQIRHIKENIRLSVAKSVSSSSSMKSRDFEKFNQLASSSDRKTITSNLAGTNTLALMVRDLIGLDTATVEIYARLDPVRCQIVAVQIIYGSEFKQLNDLSDVNFDAIGHHVLGTIDNFIEIAELANRFDTINFAREQSFLRISAGRDISWYMNLVGFSYLKESELFDMSLDSNRRIVSRLHGHAEYWFEAALREDPNFLPAIFNLQNMSLRRTNYAIDAYEAAIRDLLNRHYRSSCYDCVVRAAELRLHRYERRRESKEPYKMATDDLRLARSYLERKIRQFGTTNSELTTLARIVSYMETSEYQKYLVSAARQRRSISGRY